MHMRNQIMERTKMRNMSSRNDRENTLVEREGLECQSNAIVRYITTFLPLALGEERLL